MNNSIFIMQSSSHQNPASNEYSCSLMSELLLLLWLRRSSLFAMKICCHTPLEKCFESVLDWKLFFFISLTPLRTFFFFSDDKTKKKKNKIYVCSVMVSR